MPIFTMTQMMKLISMINTISALVQCLNSNRNTLLEYFFISDSDIWWTEFEAKLHQCPVPLKGGLQWILLHHHHIKYFYILSFSGPYFPVFGVIIQSKWEKIRTRKTSNTDTLLTVHNITAYSSFFITDFKHRLVVAYGI